jgi:hypothetical protein
VSPSPATARRQLQLAAAFGVLVGVANLARADDWLAVWPACSIEDASRPSLSLLYPAPGLPAVVHAGDALVVRLRTPSALTPPPGVQQERVLERWTAELSGSALRIGVEAKERHRHVLPVSSMRPDGADSLVYRVRIEIPAYVAPGTYAFALRTPFGTRSAESAVRVLTSGAIPRLARLPSKVLLPPPAAGTWPADVWIAGADAEEAAREGVTPTETSSARTDDSIAPVEASSDPAPTLLGKGTAVALRIGSELWVRGGCMQAPGSGPQAPGSEGEAAFEREISAVLATEARTRVAFDEHRAIAPPSAAELSNAVRVSSRADSVEVDNRTGRTVRELSLLLPFASRATADAGQLTLYPAIEPGARTPVAKLARWSVPAGALTKLQLGPARDPAKPLALRPSSVRSGQPARVHVLGADPRAKVAFSLGFARSAYASPDLHTRFFGPLAHPIRAQVFETDGAGQVAHGHLWVEPHRPPNCAIAQPGRKPGRVAASALTFALALLVCRRRFAKKARQGAPLE